MKGEPGGTTGPYYSPGWAKKDSMSFDVNWQNLISDNVINQSIQEFLDSQFRSIPLPSYIDNLSVSHFSLGEKAPNITIRHIGDPFDEFYHDEDDEDDLGESDKDDDHTPTKTTTGNPHLDVQPDPSFGFQVDELDARLDAIRKSIPASRPDSPNPMKPDVFRASLDSISLIMGSNNLLYAQNHTMNNLVGLGPLSNLTSNTGFENLLPNKSPHLLHSPLPLRISTSLKAQSKHENDVQLVLEIDYSGDLTIDIAVNLLVNYPSPNFISLPIKLHITGVVIHAVAVVAYLHHQVFFSFLCDIDDVNADYFSHPAAMSQSMNLHHTPSGGNFVDIVSGPSSRQRIDIIKKIHIESEIGEFENNTLRNVGKVEKFLIDQLRGIIRDEVAWPSWICIDMNDDDDEDKEQETDEGNEKYNVE